RSPRRHSVHRRASGTTCIPALRTQPPAPHDCAPPARPCALLVGAPAARRPAREAVKNWQAAGMRGASRAAFAEARDRLTAAVSDPGVAATVGDELSAVVGLLDREPALRRALADSTAAQAARTGLVRDLFGRRVSPATLDVLTGLAGARWSVPRDIADAAEELAVLATAASAVSADQLDDVEDELFPFGRIPSAQPHLIPPPRTALSSPAYPDEQKRELLNPLLAGKVAPPTLRLITQAVVNPRGRNL